MNNQWIKLAGLFVVGGLLLFAVFDFFKPEPASLDTGVTTGKQLPAFTLADLSGQQVTVGDPGELIVINFWATWCPPCREEMPELASFYENNRQHVRFYAVNIEESAQQVQQYMQRSGYQLPVLLDTAGDTARLFKINAIPTTIIIDKKGVIQFRKAGTVTRAELETAVNRL